MTSVAEPSEDWLPVGQEPHPLGSITHLAVLRSDETSLVSRAGGDVDTARDPAAGLYRRDTRYLSKLKFSFGGVEPLLVDSHETEHGLSAIFCNPTLRTPGGRTIPAQALTVRRRRVLVGGLLESFAISNYGREAVKAELRIEFDADFSDIFEVRGFERLGDRGDIFADILDDGVRFRYGGTDGILRTTQIRFHAHPDRLSEHEAVFHLTLEPRKTQVIEFDISAETEVLEPNLIAATALVKRRQRAWLDEVTQIETDDERVNQVLQRSMLDIESLKGSIGDHTYIAAGVPWFDTLFGRDSLITGMQLLAYHPGVLRSSLRVLAENQATEFDKARDAEPGKIPHELRWGELANTGAVPFGRYYGTVDATPLFIMAVLEYLRWTNDLELVRELWPNVEQAMAWCVRAAEEGDGFLAYQRETEIGLENQGWKDSNDGIVWPDGTLVGHPIALVEVQGYLGAAYGAYLSLAAAIGKTPSPEEVRRPSSFALQLDAAFGHEENGYVLCLDGEGTPVPTRASNAGHLLWTGMASQKHAGRVADMLMASDMFSGWGVRTLSSAVVGFNPLGYHIGSVWPHDNSLILSGLRWYGFDQQALELADAMIDMSLSFPEFRVPELFSGDARDFRPVPTPYPVASRPQAWAAGSIPYVFTSMLGIRPGRTNQLSVVRPILPHGLEEVRLRNLRLGNGSIDLTFRRMNGRVSVEVGRITGHAEVVLAASWPHEDA